jgi:hypothetical protein
MLKKLTTTRLQPLFVYLVINGSDEGRLETNAHTRSAEHGMYKQQ